MAAGLVRIIEVCFVLQDGPSDSGNIRILQYLTPYVSSLDQSSLLSKGISDLRWLARIQLLVLGG
jgi:hypothetical protein